MSTKMYFHTVKNFTVAIFLILLITACVSAPPSKGNSSSSSTSSNLPSKFLNPNEEYSSNSFIAAVGSGDTLSSAQKSALGVLAQQIKVQVQSTETLSQSITETEGNDVADFFASTTLDQNTTASAEQQLLGVQYGESFTDNLGTVYVIAFINRLSVGNMYRQQIDERNKQINTFIQKSTSSRGLDKYALLAKSLVLSKENDAQLEQLDVIAPAMANISRTSSEITSGDIALEIKEHARSIRVVTETNVTGTATKTVNAKINAAVINLFSDLQFSVNPSSSSSDLPYIIRTSLIWEETSSGKYPSIQWDINLQFIENGQVLISNSKKGNSKAKDIPSASNFALHDITKIISVSFKDYLLNKLAQ